MATSDTAGQFATDYLRRVTAVLAEQFRIDPGTVRDVTVTNDAAGSDESSTGLERWIAVSGVDGTGQPLAMDFDTLPGFIAALDAVPDACDCHK